MTTIETVDGMRGIMVKMGLGQPASRAFVAMAVAAGVLYAAGKPAAAFREDGSMKPLAMLSAELDATTTHFLLIPSAVGVAAWLFT